MNKQLLFLAILLFSSCAFSSTKNDKTTNENVKEETKLEKSKAVDCAVSFINSYVKNENSTGNMYDDFMVWEKPLGLVTESFKTELKKIIDKGFELDPELGLDFDPIEDAQDTPDDGYQLDYFDEENNYVYLKGINAEQFKIVVKVIQENSKYLVDGCGIINIPDSIHKKHRGNK